MKNKVYTGVWVPEKILSTKIKSGNERLLLAMIFELSKKGGCIASNKYFSKVLFLSESQISKIISKLNKKGVINHFVDKKQGNKRTLTINNETLYANSDIPMCKNNDTLYANIDTNIIEDKIYINPSTTTKKLKSNLNLINSLCESKNISEEILFKHFEDYSNFLVNTQKEIHINDNDLFKHFMSWLESRNIDFVDQSMEINIEWFVKTFNKISRRNFRVNSTIKKYFIKQYKVGFTGNEMATAIKNLYSSSLENKFHKDSSFKHATPEYLLKDNNLNKYLNFGRHTGDGLGGLTPPKRLN